MKVTILGNNSALPAFGRHPTSQIVSVYGSLIMLDCGEGTQVQMQRYALRWRKLGYICISHLHGDHYFGLIGLLSSLHLNGRVKPIEIFAPEPLQEILDLQFKYSETIIRYPIEFVATQANESARIFENADLVVDSFVLNHRIPCTGFKFTQKKRLRKLIVEKLEEEQIDIEYYPLLKRGVDLNLPDGRVILNKDYTTDSDTPKKYGYCSDTLFDEGYFDNIANCDMLYHEATFLHEMLDRANVTHHTTALQAGEIAKMTGAVKLLIGHFSSRYKTLQPLLEEAKSVFENTELAIEGNTYTI